MRKESVEYFKLNPEHPESVTLRGQDVIELSAVNGNLILLEGICTKHLARILALLPLGSNGKIDTNVFHEYIPLGGNSLVLRDRIVGI